VVDGRLQVEGAVLNVVATRLSPVDAVVNDRTDDAESRERRTRVDLARQQRMFR
jgi:hypothetical protein